MNKNMFRLIVALLAIMVLAVACGQAAEPEVVEVTRVVTEMQEVEVTRVVDGETETIIEEIEVTRVVEVEPEVEEAPDPFAMVGDPSLEGTVTWYLGGDSDFYYEIADAFMEEYPGIEIEVMGTPWGEWSTRFVTMAAAGQMPDVIWFIAGQPGLRLDVNNWADQLVDLSPFMEEMGTDDFISESLLDAATVDGRLVGLPYEFNNILLFYNKEMFDEAGLDYPNEDWTWDDLLEAGKVLTKEDGSQYGLVWSQFEDHIVLAGGGTPMFNEDATAANYNTEAAKAAYDFVYDMYVAEGIAPRPGEDTGIGMETGTAAMQVHGNFFFNTLRGAEIPFGSTLIPAGPAGHTTLQRENIWSVSQDAECLECALTFAKYLGMQEGLDSWAASGRLAPYKRYDVASYLESTGVAGTEYEDTFVELMENTFKNAEYAMPTQKLPSFIDNGDVDQIVTDQRFLMLAEGSQDVDTTLANLQETLDAYLAAGWDQ